MEVESSHVSTMGNNITSGNGNSNGSNPGGHASSLESPPTSHPLSPATTPMSGLLLSHLEENMEEDMTMEEQTDNSSPLQEEEADEDDHHTHNMTPSSTENEDSPLKNPDDFLPPVHKPSTTPSTTVNPLPPPPPPPTTSSHPTLGDLDELMQSHMDPDEDDGDYDEDNPMNNQLSDAERFSGRIVYNPDGSAYIIEGSETSDVESEVGSLLKEGSIVDTTTTSFLPPASLPQVVSAHVVRPSSSSYPSASANTFSSSLSPLKQGGSRSTKSPSSSSSHLMPSSLSQGPCDRDEVNYPEVPIMHSYRVFSLRDGCTPLPSTSSSSSEEEPTLSSSVTVPIKPILMCFICKMSFGFVKSFMSHATSDHGLVLTSDETRFLMGQKNTSAIIQGAGKEKEPMLSFLEPKSTKPLTSSSSSSSSRNKVLSLPISVLPPTSCSSSSYTGTTSSSPPSVTSICTNPLTNSTTPTTTIKPSSSNSPSSSPPLVATPAAVASVTSTSSTNSSAPTSTSSASSLHQQFQQQLMAMAAAQAAAVAALRGESPPPPSSSPSINSFGLMLEEMAGKQPTLDEDEGTSDLADLMNLEKIAKAAAAAIQHQQQQNFAPNSSHSPPIAPKSPTPSHHKSSSGHLLSQQPPTQTPSHPQPHHLPSLLPPPFSTSTSTSAVSAAASATSNPLNSLNPLNPLHGLGSLFPGLLIGDGAKELASNPAALALLNQLRPEEAMALFGQGAHLPPVSSPSQMTSHLNGGSPTSSGSGSSSSNPTAAGLMQHSRNSCKTLKCPKCNWHYKYQETLEIHMKEKHPENDLNCMFCLTNQPHPRLARGETYTCGYKPYRCDVCNYSTTTKGNLSIHMQSDKHINNVQEMQAGSMTPEQQHLIQSQALALAVAAAGGPSPVVTNTSTSKGGSTSSSAQMGHSNASSPGVGSNMMTGPMPMGQGNPSSSSPSASAGVTTVSSSPPTSMTSSSAAPSLNSNAGGSSSGLQSNLMMTLSNLTPNPMHNPHHHMSSPSPIPSGGSGGGSQGSTPNSNSNKGKATWRCDVCNYETNVARNLRIHMTSEKHTHNMMVLQQNVKHMQQLTALQQAGLLSAGDPMLQFNPTLLAALSNGVGPSGNNNPMMSPNSQQQQQQQSNAAALAAISSMMGGDTNGNQGNPQNGLQPEAALADMAYNHALLMMASQQHQQRAMVAMMGSPQGHQGSNKNGGFPAPTLDMEHPDPSLRLESIPYDEHCHMFQCCTCTVASFDTIEQLSNHIQMDRTRIREDEVLMVSGGNFVCKLCQYKTNLKANFQLHCKTDKHLQRLQQVNHIKEGGHRTEWKVKLVNVSNPVQVRCNVCDYYTNSVHKLQMHCATNRHEATARVFMHLQLSHNILRAAHDFDTRSLYYHCSLCNHSVKTKVALVHHVNSMKHLQNENMRQLKMQQQGLGHQVKSLDEEIRDMFQVKEASPGDNIHFSDAEGPRMSSDESPESAVESMLKQALQEQQQQQQQQQQAASKGHNKASIESCPYCNFFSTNEVKMQLHLLENHRKQLSAIGGVVEKKPKMVLRMLCPLCQSVFDQKESLEGHLMDAHTVTEERVTKLMQLVEQTEVPLEDMTSSDRDRDRKRNKPDDDDFDRKSDCSDSSAREEIEQQAAKFLKLGGGVPAAVSDRHVYKYRCNQCSLAFKTMEKLQLHSQYHLIRAATQCAICQRSFRSVEALQKHVESSHQDMTGDEADAYRHSIANNPLLARRMQGGVLDPSTTELLKKESNRNHEEDDMDYGMGHNQMDTSDPSLDNDNNLFNHNNQGMDGMDGGGQNSLEDYLNSQSVAEDAYNDPQRKFKCHRCKVGFTRQSYLTSHNKTLLHRKGEKMSYPMEKYLDPNRPFKCDICKESFTQKNILLVHYNSVSHLHKLKISQKEQQQMQQQGMNHSTSSINTMNLNESNVSLAVSSSTTPSSSPSVAATSSSSSSSSSGVGAAGSDPDSDKKPFKCNICKVSYNQGTALDIHVRSVLHQTRASKLHDLAISGQIDLSQPLIERPDPDQPQQQQQNQQNQSHHQQQQHQRDPSPKGDKGNKSVPQSGPDVNPFMTPEQQALQQAFAMNAILMGAGTPGPGSISPCNRCGSIFPNQETFMQHQQLCSLLNPLPGPVAPSNGNGNSKGDPIPLTSPMTVQVPKVNYSAPISRSKPPIYKHLLETFGFEIVMQFNENRQSRKRITSRDQDKVEEIAPFASKDEGETDGNGESKNGEPTGTNEGRNQPNETTGETPSAPATESSSNTSTPIKDNDDESKDPNLPEINRSKCDLCYKEFSSIWVLKAHKEEFHKQIVPLDMVESFADEFRKDYDKKVHDKRPSSPGSMQAGDSDGESRPTPAQTPLSEMGDRPSSSFQVPSSAPTPTGNTMSSLPPLSPALSQSGSNQPPTNSLAAALGAAAQGMDPQQMAAQLQFTQLLMSMGLGGMGMNPMQMQFQVAASMGIPPPMIPLMMQSMQMDPLMAAAFNQQAAAMGQSMNHQPPQSPTPMSGQSNHPDPIMMAQQKMMAQQQQQAAINAANNQKRARTRITDDQLKILRQYFDINNSPTEEALQEMSEKSGLPLKVIKHWFRNTLFKERQRNKDSPYNFNNPPSTFLNLEEYEKTGETKMEKMSDTIITDKKAEGPAHEKAGSSTSMVHSMPSSSLSSSGPSSSLMLPSSHMMTPSIKVKEECPPPSCEPPVRPSRSSSVSDHHRVGSHNMDNMEDNIMPSIAQQIAHLMPPAPNNAGVSGTSRDNGMNQGSHPGHHRDSFDFPKSFSMSPHSESSMSSISTNENNANANAQLFGLFGATGLPPGLQGNPLAQMALEAAARQQAAGHPGAGHSNPQTPTGSRSGGGSQHESQSGSGGAPGKRANRTRFTDYQIKVLQEFFESNAYPKDDDLEYLSKLLGLSPRVIVVWFQNARQKARKVYENQPAVQEEGDGPNRFQRTPGLNYQCKKCMQVFQRYYELIKHQKSACFKDENPLALQMKAAQDARNLASASPASSILRDGGNSNHSSASANNNHHLTSQSVGPPAGPTMSFTGSSGNNINSINNNNEKSPNVSQSMSSTPSAGAFRCEKCSLVFPRFDLWREHQLVHLMNPTLFPPQYPPSTPFGILQSEGSTAGSNPSTPNPIPQLKRKSMNDDEDSQESFSGNSNSQANSQCGNDQTPRDKRLRTTILPEQLDYLYQKYQIESNPSRKMLENIAKEVGLKKRVVQVWFQNTRARERKGQFRAHQQVIHKRCPFCRALFKARSALESHLATRHADQYTKGDINIDALPDGDPDEDDGKMQKPADMMQQYYENTIKKYMEEFVSPSEGGGGAGALDLSRPMDLNNQFDMGPNGYDSDNDSDPESDGDDGSNPNSPAPGSTTSSVTSPATIGGNGQLRSSTGSSNSNANKRFRTQMTTVQVKVMKATFNEYKTPTMAECETLGREVGLPKRVVQVWFQNARAKEKKARLAYAKSFGHEMPEGTSKANEECTLCGIKYNLKFSSTSMQDHLFSRVHLDNLKTHIESQKKGEGSDESGDFSTSGHHHNDDSGDEGDMGDVPSSQSAANLMQQLHIMGLAGALSMNHLPSQLPDLKKEKASSSSSSSLKKQLDDTGNGSDGPDGENNSFPYSLFNNPYFSQAAATSAFLPNGMYNNPSGRNKL